MGSWVALNQGGGDMARMGLKGFCILTSVVCWGLCGASLGLGQERRLFSDPDAVDISLITVVPGTLVYDNFGHTALRVNDHAAGEDLAFNWGIFDFSDPLSFSLRFYKGILIYKLGVYPYRIEASRFNVEERTAYEDQLRLTRAQKEILLKRLIWHIQPENIDYHYDYFYDNCATRPRDYIDEALGGALRPKYSQEPTGESYREVMRSHYQSLPPIDLALDVLMNSRIDVKMSAWDKGFLPVALREMLLSAQNPTGGEGGGAAQLVAQSKVVASFPARWQGGPSGHLLYLLLSGALLLGCLLPLFIRKKPALRLLGLAALLYGLLLGLIGLSMPFNWLLSDHLDLHHNANMLFFWPFDLVYLYFGWCWLRLGRPLVIRRWWVYRLFFHYQDLHILIMVLGLILWRLGIIQQDIAAISVYVLLPTLVLWIEARRFGFCRIAGGCGANVHGKEGN